MSLSDSVLRRLEGHPIIQQVQSELDAELVAERRRLVTEIRQLQEQAELDAEPLRAATGKATVARDRAYLAFAAAEGKRVACESEEVAQSNRLEREVGQREIRLRELASPDIQAALVRLARRFDAGRHQPDMTSARVLAFQEARQQLEALKLAVEADVSARVREIEASVDK